MMMCAVLYKGKLKAARFLGINLGNDKDGLATVRIIGIEEPVKVPVYHLSKVWEEEHGFEHEGRGAAPERSFAERAEAASRGGVAVGKLEIVSGGSGDGTPVLAGAPAPKDGSGQP